MNVGTTPPESTAQPIAVEFTLNGRPVSVRPDPRRSLLSVLRDDFDIISPKNGCEPMGQCGCCTVLINGRPRLSCTIPASAASDKSVTTLEGLPDETRKQIADCFVHAGGVQCGFCIPGIAIRAYALCGNGARPKRDEINHELRAHLCRCTGYTKIVDAIDLLARVRGGEPMPTDGCAGRVGERLHRYSGHDAALGARRFIDDMKLPGMVFAAPRLSDHPRALVRRINAAPALAMPGVLRVVTASDVPGKRHVGLITPDWPVFVAEGEETRYVGDVLAFVVATDMLTARDAAERIDVDYDVRTPVTTPDEALRPDAPKIHPGGNLLSRSALTRGDVDGALARSAHVVEDVWQTQCIEHLYLEPEACIAEPLADAVANSEATERRSDEATKGERHEGVPANAGQARMFDGEGEEKRRGANKHDAICPKARLRVFSQGQGVFDDRRQIASVLGWPVEQVQVDLVSNGGAFGGKEDMSVQAQTALCAVLVGRPVKCVLTREQSMRLHPKRHPVRIALEVGCDKEGRLTAVRARIVGDKGAYASVGAKVLERAAGHAIGPYRCDHVDIESLAVYTNNPPNGAMRGFGANQAAYAIEGAMDRLAERVGIDGWEIRWRNILRQGDRFCTGQRLTKPFGLEQTLLAVRDAYRGAKYAGIACGIKNVGIGNGLPEIGRASLTIEPDGTITLRTGHTEMGQGLFTVAIQTAVEETGLPAELFRAACDTSGPLDSGQTTGSRGTVLTCHAVIDACRKLNVELEAEARRHEGTKARRGGKGNSEQAAAAKVETSKRRNVETSKHEAKGHPPEGGEGTRPGWECEGATLRGQLLRGLAGRKFVGEWACYKTDKFGADVPDPKTHLTYGFATQVCILNDEGRIQKFIAAHDVGRVMNPTLLEGQLEGSIHMGLGYALTEEMVYEQGRLVTNDVKSCGVLRAHHMPEIELILIEVPDPECPYGARGVAEIGLVPTAPAVAGALAKFEGRHRNRLPMKDSAAARAVGARVAARSL